MLNDGEMDRQKVRQKEISSFRIRRIVSNKCEDTIDQRVEGNVREQKRAASSLSTRKLCAPQVATGKSERDASLNTPHCHWQKRIELLT